MDENNYSNNSSTEIENPYEDANEIHGPFYDEDGRRISFKQWFYEGDPIVKKDISGPLLSGLTFETFKTVLAISILMAYVTLYHNTFGFRFYISTSDNFSSITASIETIIRSFGSLFIHADIGHLSSNLVLLIPFGWLLINYFGPLAFPVIAIIGGIITNIITIYIYKNDYYQTSLVGASGMAYAIVSQWIVLYLKWDRRYSLTERIIRSIGVAMMLLIPSQFSPKTSYLAHGVGFIVGIICALPFLRGSDSE